MAYEVKNISYKYRDDVPEVLKDVSFTMEEGEIACIVGPSGSGKSTLGSVLSGVIPKLITGGDLSGAFSMSEDVAVVSQSPENQLFGYGVEDAIAFGIENMGLLHEEIVERVEYVLELLNIEYLRERSVSTLSGGQRQAVCIASVLAMQPKVLILDEPVSSLDPRGKAMVRRVLSQLQATGQTTLIIDNNLDWCDEVVEHVIGLKDGMVCFDGTRDEFYNDFDMQIGLGVVIPQEVELFRALKTHFPETNMFYTIEGAKVEIEKLLTPENREESVFTLGISKEVTLEVGGLSKTFGDGFNALIDINAGFGQGRVVSILGQNGSGKTTLVKHLNGLYRPTHGSVSYRGDDIAVRSVAQISKDIILVFQHPEHMLFEETVLGELTFCARMQGVHFTDEEAMEALREFGLDSDAEELPVNLSMGKKHILTILSVLFSSARVVILDEPTLGMDNFLKQKLIQIIKRLAAEGRTVIMISHEIPMVFGVTQDVLALNDGRVLFEGCKQSLVGESSVFETMRISRPPIIELARHFGLPTGVFTVDDFVRELLAAREKLTL